MTPSYAAELIMPSMRTGETFKERTFTVTGTHLADLSKVVVTTYTQYGLSSDVALEISITSAVNRVFKILTQKITWPPRIYRVMFQMTFSDGTVRTYMYSNWTITE